MTAAASVSDNKEAGHSTVSCVGLFGADGGKATCFAKHLLRDISSVKVGRITDTIETATQRKVTLHGQCEMTTGPARRQQTLIAEEMRACGAQVSMDETPYQNGYGDAKFDSWELRDKFV